MNARVGQALLFIAGPLIAAGAVACADSAVAPEPPAPGTPPAGTLNVGIVVPDDGTVLSGRLFGDEYDALVILSHMRPNDQTAWFPFARELAANGFAALTYDFRGYGASGGSQDFAKLDDDLAATVRFMRARGKTAIFLVGASMGGTTSLVVAAEEDVAGVVTISAPAEFQGQNAKEAISAVTEPTLLIAAEGDAAARISLEELVEAQDGAESRMYPGDAHGTNLLEGENADAVRAQIFSFLREHRE